MIVVVVDVHVKPEDVDAFEEATVENAAKSLEEPGVVRFDVLRREGDPSRFLLVEVYRTEEDPARHKQTEHYRVWKDAVEHMMAEPRSSARYTAVFPGDTAW
ncbi:MAG TPA: antibiotic biosynthesis monooxygenase [Deltaproteobacteria bacterium]|nr:antibiotic biosynthesis monooxygenase [Deltaproteobacteria bacterium]